MNNALATAAEAFVARARLAGQSGTQLSDVEAGALRASLRDAMPRWYQELLTSLPLAGIEFGYGEPDEDGFRPHHLVLNDAAGIRSESLEAYPGCAILGRGYINLASDPIGSGDPYFLAVGGGVDSPVYQVFHDVSDHADEILAHGVTLVAPTLSTLLSGACFDT